MTFDEFVSAVKRIHPDCGYGDGYYVGDHPEMRGHNKHLSEKDLLLVKKVETGGYAGGNCWDDTVPSYYSTGNFLEDFDGLREVIQELCPSMPFNVYVIEILPAIHTGDYDELEYYGNSVHYEFYYANLYDIWLVIRPYVTA